MVCNKNQKKSCGNYNCKICFERSLASYKDITKKGNLKIDRIINLKPIDILKGSHKIIDLLCDFCNHDFYHKVYSLKNNWCPYCSSNKMCSNKDCKFCLEKSFASYQGKTKKGKLKKDCILDIDPREIFKGAHRNFDFDCDICDHKFNSRIAHITVSGSWCPYCCFPAKKLCSNKDCKFCFNNSMASYEGKTIKGKLKIDCYNKEKMRTPLVMQS